MDTKFIETRKAILMTLLPLVLPPEDRAGITGLSWHGFERKFGLKYDPPLIRYRLLDPDLIKLGFSDYRCPFKGTGPKRPGRRYCLCHGKQDQRPGISPGERGHGDFRSGVWGENTQANPLAWKKNIVYWGDIDTHGFAILSRLRDHFPKVSSMLMDHKTLIAHENLWGTEDPAKRHTNDLARLTKEEHTLFLELQQDRLGSNIRLEQERIRFSYLVEKLQIRFLL